MRTQDYDEMNPFSGHNRDARKLSLRWLWLSITAVVVVGIIVIILGFVLNWFGAAAQVYSPDNVREQYRAAYTNYESLKATAGNVCQARKDEASAPTPDIKVQFTTQRSAYEQNYRRIQATYDAAYDDAWRAKHVGPSDIPNKAPDLDSMLVSINCR